MANSKKRVFICGFHQESNSFNPVLSPVKMFYINQKDTAKNIYKYEKKSSPGGMASFLEEAENIETVYGILMRANSGAPAKAEVAEFFLEQVISDIREAGKIDGVAISLHRGPNSLILSSRSAEKTACVRAASHRLYSCQSSSGVPG